MVASMKNLLVIFCLLYLGIGMAAAQTATNKQEVVYLNHIALIVADLGKSTTFYEKVLHLKQIPEPFKDGLHTWFSLGSAGQLHLIQFNDSTVTRNKHDHVCFSVKSIDDFVATLNQYKIPYMNWSGVAQTITTRVDGVRQVFFQDPDGHYIEVNDDFPK
jgi:lactoylglutathione lyase